jgi:hypothetical protein
MLWTCIRSRSLVRELIKNIGIYYLFSSRRSLHRTRKQIYKECRRAAPRPNNRRQENYHGDLSLAYYTLSESRNGTILFTAVNWNKTEAHGDRSILPHSSIFLWHNYNIRLTLVKDSMLPPNVGQKYDPMERIEKRKPLIILDDKYPYLLSHSYLDQADALDWETTATDSIHSNVPRTGRLVVGTWVLVRALLSTCYAQCISLRSALYICLSRIIFLNSARHGLRPDIGTL